MKGATRSFVFVPHRCRAMMTMHSLASNTSLSRAFVVSTRCFSTNKDENGDSQYVNLREQEDLWDDEEDADWRTRGISSEHNRNKQPKHYHHHGLESGSEHYGKIVSLKNFGAFVKINDSGVQGLVPLGEIADEWVEDASHHVSLGQHVKVRVLNDNERGQLRLSIKRVRPLLSKDFKPATIALFRVPFDMDKHEIQSLIGEYGNVLDIFMSWSYHEVSNTRDFVFCTFDNVECAAECIAKLHKQRVPYRIGNETHTFQILVKMSNQQNYKQKLQAQLDEEWEEKMREWETRDTPESKWAQRMAKRALRDIVPYHDM